MTVQPSTSTTAVRESAAESATIPEFTEHAAVPGAIEVLRAGSGSPIRFGDEEALRAAILAGEIRRMDSVRRIVVTTSGDETSPKWTTVEEFARGNASLRRLYRPMWTLGLHYASRGALAGIAVKALDTTATLFYVNPNAGWLWLGTIASLFLTRKWPWAPAVPLVIALNVFPKANFFIMALGTATAGAFFGWPLGMIVGVLVARFHSSPDAVAPDALPEGSRPLWLGVALPAAVLLAGASLYIWVHLKLAAGEITF
ncbi:hypothetical protein [Candidatus Accumulibacter sp. ACC005]|uniref:hypothetical protein n=1 Tax=Candidatus Accumulibacter sp. ACC005 TaxID=2823331 RepID=UPI0025C31589|nr:hypothetical protein [Candidatus Accumulibacter sp. ACC005]